jgi:hypothetical protein
MVNIGNLILVVGKNSIIDETKLVKDISSRLFRRSVVYKQNKLY